MSLRDLRFRLSLQDEIKNRLLELKGQLFDLDGKNVEVGVDVSVNGLNGLQSAKATAAEAGKRISESTSQVSSRFDQVKASAKGLKETLVDAGKRGAESFKSVASSLGELTDSAGKLMGSLAVMSAGGAIAGISWLDAMKSNLAAEQTYSTYDQNRSFKITGEEAKKRVQEIASQGWITSSQMREAIGASYLYGGKKTRGEKSLDIAEQAAKVQFANQESLGGYNAADITRIATRQGELRLWDKQAFATAVGVGMDDKRLDSVAGRLKLLKEAAEDLNMEEQIGKRPWITAENSLKDLKKSIGEQIAPALTAFAGGFATILKIINAIPGAPGLIGLIAVLVALTGATSLLVGVLRPLGSLIIWTAAKAGIGATANTALAASEVGVAASAWAAASGLWAMLAPILLIGVPLLALAGILYYAETKTHIFSNALKTLSKTQMAKDVLDWFRDLGSWINEGVRGVDRFYKATKLSGGLDVAMKAGVIFALGPLGKVLLPVAGYLSDLLGGQKRIEDYVEAAKDRLKGILDFFGWLLSTIKSMWTWLMGAIPGAAKEAKRQEIAEMAEKKGLTFNAVKGTFANEYGNVVSPTGKLSEKVNEWQRLPGFAEGIADAVRQGIGSIGDDIANKLKDIFPDFSPLMKSLEDLVKPIKDLAAAIENWTGGGNVDKKYVDNNWWHRRGENQFYYELPEGGGSPNFTFDELPENVKNAYSTGAASGAHIRRSGGIRVHNLEEIVPAAQSIRGPGAIARAIDQLYAAQSAGVDRSSQSATVNNYNSIDIHVDRIEKDADFDNLVFKLRGELEGLNRRNIGYLRGGTIGR